MKTKLVNVAIAIVLLSCGVTYLKAQTPGNQDLDRLKEEIQRRELVDRDNTILADDKQINRINLDKARASLIALVQAHIEAKKKLRFLLGPSITPEESENIEAALRRLEADMKQLEGSRSVLSSSSQTDPESSNRTVNQPLTSDNATSAVSGRSSQPGPAAMSNVSSPSLSASSGESVISPTIAPTSSSGPAAAPASLNAAAGDVLPIRKCSDVQQNLGSASNLEKFFCGRVAVIQRDKHTAGTPIIGLDLRRDFFFFMITLLAKEGRAQYVVAAENERVDKQGGSDASSSGSTSLVSKGSVPTILGFAVDTGALLKSTNGSTITFRGNVTGLAKALAGKGFITGFDEDSPTARFLRRTSFSFSFDPTRGNQMGVFTGSKQQLSNYSVRLDVYNKRDARDARYKKDWDNFLANQSQGLVAQIDSSLRVLTNPSTNTWTDPSLQDWYVLADSAVRGVDGIDQIDAVLREQLNKAPKNLAPTTLAELRSFDKRFKAWLDERESILDRIAKAPIVTFEYINDRPLNAGSLSKFSVIGEGGFGPRLDLTFNGSVTMFNKKPTVPSQNRIRDFQFAGQFDAPFGEIGMGLGKPVLSFAGRYERLISNATTVVGTTAPNTKGDIGVGQIKLTIPVKNSGIRIPISFSFANRTELIKEKEVRGNFGFTFDLDTLFALFKPFSQK